MRVISFPIPSLVTYLRLSSVYGLVDESESKKRERETVYEVGLKKEEVFISSFQDTSSCSWFSSFRTTRLSQPRF